MGAWKPSVCFRLQCASRTWASLPSVVPLSVPKPKGPLQLPNGSLASPGHLFRAGGHSPGSTAPWWQLPDGRRAFSNQHHPGPIPAEAGLGGSRFCAFGSDSGGLLQRGWGRRALQPVVVRALTEESPWAHETSCAIVSLGPGIAWGRWGSVNNLLLCHLQRPHSPPPQSAQST